jgi:hypothetical protein
MHLDVVLACHAALDASIARLLVVALDFGSRAVFAGLVDATGVGKVALVSPHLIPVVGVAALVSLQEVSKYE